MERHFLLRDFKSIYDAADTRPRTSSHADDADRPRIDPSCTRYLTDVARSSTAANDADAVTRAVDVASVMRAKHLSPL